MGAGYYGPLRILDQTQNCIGLESKAGVFSDLEFYFILE